MRLTVSQLAERLGAELIGSGSGYIAGVHPVEGAGESDVTFVSNTRSCGRLRQALTDAGDICGLANSRAGAVIVAGRIEKMGRPQLVVRDVDTALVEVLSLFAPKLKAWPAGIDPMARVGENVGIGQNVSVGAGVVIDDGAETGANCCIDRAKFGNTIIGAGTKIDNLAHIAHNVVIGRCCLISGQVGISGSCKLDDRVVLGSQAGMADNITIGGGTAVGAQSGVTHDIKAGQQVLGTPATNRKEAMRAAAMVRRLPKLAEQLKQLAKRIERLEAAKDDKG